MGLSNVENILQNILDGTTPYTKPLSRVEILLAEIKDLIAALQNAVNLKGETTTPLTDNATTNPIMIDGESYTAVMNDAVIYQSGEFIFDGTKWHELGDLSNLTAANIGAMTGYSKPSETSAIAVADTLNEAIGKLEKALDLKQATIDTDNKLSSDLVDDANATNKFATAAELEQIETNKTNISKLLPTSYIVPRLSQTYNVTLVWGGYCKVGNVCIVNMRLNVGTDITHGDFFVRDLPTPASSSDLTAGQQFCPVTNNRKQSIAIAIDSQTTTPGYAAAIANIETSADTTTGVLTLFGMYLCE